MPAKGSKQIERKRHYHAFEIYRDLGYGRTYREVARQIEGSVQSVCRWVKYFKWEERLTEYNIIVAEKKEAGILMKVDDPVVQKVVTMMEQMEAVIDSAFLKDATGKYSPKVKVKNVEELTKFIAEYRKTLEAYHRFVAEFKPAKKEKERGTHIREFNLNFGDLSQQERIDIMKGVLPDGNEPKGDKQPAGGIQDADYTEVPGQGDED